MDTTIASTRNLPEPTIVELVGVQLPGSRVSLDGQKKAGKYDWMNDDITVESFPLTLPAGPRDLFLAHFGVNVQSEEVKAWAKERGKGVGIIGDLLAVGSHPEYKELQRQFPIVALESFAVIPGRRIAFYLNGHDSGRGLELRWYDAGWSYDCRFLLCKASQPSAA